MKLDLKKYKKVAADKNMTVLQHDDGHEVKIAHQHISPKFRSQLEAIPPMYNAPKMYEGEEVPSGWQQGSHSLSEAFKSKKKEQPIQQASYEIPSNEEGLKRADERIKKAPSTLEEIHEQYPVQYKPIGGFIADTANMLANRGEQAPDQALMYAAQPQQQPTNLIDQPIQPAVQAPQIQPAAQQSMPDIYGEMYKQYEQGYGKKQQGLEKQAEAEQEVAKQTIPILEQKAQQTQNVLDMFNAHKNQIMQERQNIINDMQQNHINPNQFWEDRSTVGKIGSILGLVMGGIGSGLTGQENPALKLINAQIDRNIEAQKINMQNKSSVLNHYRDMLGDEAAAANMARLVMTDQVDNQIKMLAAKTADPQIKARLLQLSGDLQVQAAPIMGQMALRKTVLGASSNMDPATKIRFSPFLEEPQKEAAFKELTQAQEDKKGLEKALSQLDRAYKINTVLKRTLSPIQTKKELDAIKGSIIPSMSKDTAGRYTESDAKAIESMFDTLGSDPKTFQAQKRALTDLLTKQMNYPRLQSIGIDPMQGGRYNTQGQNLYPVGAPVKGK